MQRRSLRERSAIALVVGLCAGPALAQSASSDWSFGGEVGAGGRTTWGEDEQGAFQEYRDLSDGFVGDFLLRLERAARGDYFRGSGENVGYDDQSYWFEGGRAGRFLIDAFVQEIPQVPSTGALTLYARDGSAYRLPPGVPQNVAAGTNAADRSARLASELLGARAIDLGFRWLEAGVGAKLTWSDALRFRTSYRVHDKSGTRALALQWGSPGGNFAVFPLAIDEKIHEIQSGLELVLGERSLALEHRSSLFENALRRALVDNPLVAADAATAASRGGLALAPDNAAHSLALSGATPLPFPIPARLVASVVYGLHTQTQRFEPHTVNTDPAFARPGLALPQGDLDGRVETLLASFHVNLDPRPGLDVDLRYRVYRYDNESDELLFPEHVTNDDALGASPRRSVANDYTVHRASVDASRRLGENWKAQLGYFAEHWKRSEDRQVRRLTEHGPTAKLDFRPAARTALHASYAFRTRDGDGYDPFAHFDEALDPAGQADARAFGESPALRKYDQADRDTHRFDLQATHLPGERLELSLAGGLLLTDYARSELGLTSERSWHVGGEAHLALHARAALRAYYDHEWMRSAQDSRWRPRSFAGVIVALDDPANDWSSRTRSRFHSAGLALELALLPERVALDLGYDFHRGRERTFTSGAPGFVPAPPPTTSGDGGNAFDFPRVGQRLHALTADLSYDVNERLSLVAQYRYEDLNLSDFRRQGLGPFLASSNVNGSGAAAASVDVFLANELRSYRAQLLRLMARVRF